MNVHEYTLKSRQSPTCLEFMLRGRLPYQAARLALAVFFLVAAVYKFADLDAFASTIAAFGLLPAPLVGWAALLLPIAEFLAALALVFDIRGGLAVIAALTLLFIAVLGYGIALGMDIDCGCYGPGDPKAEAFSSLQTSLYRDFGLLALAGYCHLWRRMNRHQPLGIRTFAKRLLHPTHH